MLISQLYITTNDHKNTAEPENLSYILGYETLPALRRNHWMSFYIF